MNTHSTLRLPNGDTLAYHATQGKSPGVIFLGGYLSDMYGSKATYLDALCKQLGHSFIRFDNFAHGLSSGEFKNMTLGKLKQNALTVLDTLTQGPQIIIGSSLGGWLMLLVALERPERIHALIGIAPAPDFTADPFLDILPAAIRKSLEKSGIWTPSAWESLPPMTLTFIEESRNHFILNKPLPIHCPVHLFHGMQDKEVPWQGSLKITELLETKSVRISLTKQGDHRLSDEEHLKQLGQIVTATLT